MERVSVVPTASKDDGKILIDNFDRAKGVTSYYTTSLLANWVINAMEDNNKKKGVSNINNEGKKLEPCTFICFFVLF